jgi:hypothetical protein
MNRGFWLGSGIVIAIGAVLFWALGGPEALFGTGAKRAPSGSEAPADASGEAGRDGKESAEADATRRSAVLFGSPREARRGRGTVEGRVIAYRDQKPAAGVRVTLKGEGFGAELAWADVTSDASGVFRMDDVPAGESYAVTVEPGAKAKDEPPLVLPGVEVRARRTTDLGTLYLGARAPLSGRVVDEKGTGLPGTDVRAFAKASLIDVFGNLGDLFGKLDQDPEPRAKAKSDANGRFTLADLPPGGYLVRATLPGRRQAVARVQLTASGPAGGEPTIVLDRGAPLAGHVVDGAGAGVARARLALVVGDADDPMAFLYGRVFAETDEHGAFRAVVAREAKEVRAIVAAEGRPTTMSGSIRPGDEDVRIVLLAGARLDVVVTEKAGGEPIEGAQVMAMVSAAADADWGGAMMNGVTDARGERSFAVPPGTVQMLFVTHPKFAGGMASGMGMSQGGIEVEGSLSTPIAAGSIARVVVRMRSGSALVGKVTAPDGTPIAGAELRPWAMMGFGGGSDAVTHSAVDGTYRLEGFVATNDSAMVFVRASGWVQGGDGMMVHGTPDASGVVTHDFVLRPAATVRGRVVDGDGNGVAGATVSPSVADDFTGVFGTGATAVTGPDGTYVLY